MILEGGEPIGRVEPTTRNVRKMLEPLMGREEVWRAMNFPLPVLVSAKESERLDIDTGERMDFFEEMLVRVFCEDPLEEPMRPLLVMLQFLDDEKGELGLVVAVRTHDLSLGNVEVSGVEAPAFLSWKYHGQPCERVSKFIGNSGYPHITVDRVWEIIDRQEKGLGVVKDENKMIPFPSAQMRKKRLVEMGLM